MSKPTIPEPEDEMSEIPPSGGLTSATTSRRPDLDALRAFAMLLGIVLHAGLSFAPLPWIVRDSRQNEIFGLFISAIHGFRMPLFFLLSGFFTAMLWRRRGMLCMLKQRAMRIFLPCMLGLATIIPVLNLVSAWAALSGIKLPQTDDGTLVAAIRRGDLAATRQRLDKGADVEASDSSLGVTPLAWAALRGDVDAARLLIDRGADVNSRNRDGSSPLHAASFLGRKGVVELLIERGADVNARGREREKPMESTRADWELTRAIAGLLSLPIGEKGDIERDRAEVRRLLQGPALTSDDVNAASSESRNESGGDGVLAAYQQLVSSDRLSVQVGSVPLHLIQTPVFGHLWFLWFLCWLVPIFAALAWSVDRHAPLGVPSWLILSPVRLLWLIPLTLVPQYVMGSDGPTFGPDASTGILPKPHLLLYFGIFFGFGALYYDARDVEGRLGRWWWLLLPMGLLIALPAGISSIGDQPVAAIIQVVYAWAMSFGLMGLFRRILTRENSTIRYLSDSSYWLYVVHLPLVIAAQAIVRQWALPATVKFLLVCTVVTGISLVTYQRLVRYTWLGRMLNGVRTRGESSPHRAAAPSTGPPRPDCGVHFTG
jgi:peptidoglycan/LPS O-acetylase OafA/YrhL